MPADFSTWLARRTGSRDLLGAQPENRLQGLDLNFADHGLNHLVSTFDELDDGQ